jgi:anthranilate phosphoribosyltransferase
VNISTATAFVAAELGIPIAKTGNRSVSSRCGSADVLERLGVKARPGSGGRATVSRRGGHLLHLRAAIHPGVRHAAPVRRALKVRTVFNLVGPIANAARPPWQMMGIYDPALCEPAARTLQLLGRRVALVLHGSGLDEVALHGPTTGVLLRDGELRPITITAADAGLRQAPPDALAGAGPEENAEWLSTLLEGGGPATHADAVALNAGTLAWVLQLRPTLREAVAQAREALAGGGGARRLSGWRSCPMALDAILATSAPRSPRGSSRARSMRC